MHFGFWKPGTRSRQEAILNENEEVVGMGQIGPKMRVLDVGCGIGGTAIYIAKRTGAKVTGITSDPKQVKLARKYAEREKVASLTEIVAGDFMKLDFKDGTFDVIYGIEAVCYAFPKVRFFREAHRVLKPGGRLLVLDGFSVRKPRGDKEKRMAARLKWAFALPDLKTWKEIAGDMGKAGFVGIKVRPRISETRPSVEHFWRLARWAMPVAELLDKLPVKKMKAVYMNAVALETVGESYKMGLGGYWMFDGEKPKAGMSRR